MKISQILKVGVLTVSLVGLAACSSTRGANAEGSPVNDANAAGATTMGAGGAGAYGAGGDSSTLTSAQIAQNCNMSSLQKAGYSENAYFFDYDKSDIHQQDMSSIQNLAQTISANPNMTIDIYGNTDDRGSREYNVALGQRRANAVQDLLKQYGVANKVNIVSFGAEKPIAMGTTDQDYQCNRRVDIQFKQ